MAELIRLAACFPVADVARTIGWYEKHLGFKGSPYPPDELATFGVMTRDNIEIMLQRVEDYQKPDIYDRRGRGGVWDAYIRMKGIKDFYETVKSGVELMRPLELQFYGDWQFEVRDLNGYVLVFSEANE
jgi:uncharacterized glyoxalase superfamily protein PhnB